MRATYHGSYNDRRCELDREWVTRPRGESSDHCGEIRLSERPMYMRVHRHPADRTDRSLLKHSDYESDRESDEVVCSRGAIS
jgi:hypothetical protein